MCLPSGKRGAGVWALLPSANTHSRAGQKFRVCEPSSLLSGLCFCLVPQRTAGNAAFVTANPEAPTLCTVRGQGLLGNRNEG